MSIPNEAQPVAPKRQRGRDRVEAILEAATGLLHEKSYEAVTMTEVAARSDTAIGSLYRFFPTKTALAAALLERYGAKLIGALDGLVERPGPLTPGDAAEGLMAIVQGLRRDRSMALALIDSEAGLALGKPSLRGPTTERVARLLARLGGRTQAAQAKMVLHLVKAAFALPQDDPALDAEAQAALTAYLERIRDG
jgi:AcrR family transcriptional regulator